MVMAVFGDFGHGQLHPHLVHQLHGLCVLPTKEQLLYKGLKIEPKQLCSI